MTTMATKLFSEADIEASIDIADALDVVERTYVETAKNRVLNPAKLSMHLGDDGEWPDLNAFAIDMPAYVDWLSVAGMKWAVATWDADTEMPISSLLLLFDLESGQFKSVMEGMYLTGVRTALQSVVGLNSLSPSQPDSIGVFGAGFQARFQLLVIDELLDIDEFKIYDIETESAHTLKQNLSDHIDAKILVSETPQMVTQSDALITVTNSKKPVLDDSWLDEIELVIALGSYRELPDDTILGADHLIIDHVEQCLQRGVLADLASRGEIAEADLDATIGEVLNTGYENQIQNGDQTVFVPIGLGSLDVAIAEQIYENNKTSRKIQEFEFS